MGFFANSEQLYLCLETLFTRLQRQETTTRPLLNSRLIVHLAVTDPAAEMTVNARSRPVRLTYGPGGAAPVLDVSLKADTLHAILSDQLPVGQAISSGAVRVTGPFLKALVLVDLFRSGQKIYPQVLRDIGLG